MEVNINFKTLEEAIKYFCIDKNDFYIIVDECSSLNQVLNNGSKVIYGGNGLLNGHRLWSKQIILLNKMLNRKVIIFQKKINGKFICLGKYIYLDNSKKMGFNGFTYFDVTLTRIKNPIQEARDEKEKREAKVNILKKQFINEDNKQPKSILSKPSTPKNNDKIVSFFNDVNYII
jgi:hypothetical protein